MKMLGWFWKRKGRLLFSLFLFFCLLEFSLRFFLGLGDPPLLEKDSDIGYLFQPNQDVRRFGNHVIINQFSQRSQQTGESPRYGVVRVLAVGDSVTFGGVQVPQDKTYPEQLKLLLEKNLGKSCEVLNCSAGSWGIGNHLAYLKRFGTMGSQVVILQIGSHDLLQPKSTGELVGIYPGMPCERPLCATSELFTRYVFPRFFAPSAAASAADDTDNDKTQFELNMVWTKQAVDLVQKKGASVCVLHTPDRADVVRGTGGELQQRYSKYRKNFLDLARGWQVPVLNLVDGWADRPEIATAFRDSVHLNSEGNALVAKSLEKFLIEHRLFDAANARPAIVNKGAAP